MRLLISGIIITAILAGISLFIGAADASLMPLFSDSPDANATQILLISRIPRTLAILLAGSSLAIAGLVMQMIIRNRFVEPSKTGTTESATLGFLTVTLLAPGWPMMAKMAVAAVFALAGTMMFLRILRMIRLRDMVPLVGIMLAGLIGAVTSFFAYRFTMLPSLLAWNMGDFSGVARGQDELLWLGMAATVAAYVAADRFTVVEWGRISPQTSDSTTGASC